MEFRRLVRALFLWGGIIALLFSAFFFVTGDFIVEQLGQDAQVIAVARTYLPYVIALPVVSVTAFLFDGLYIGTTATRSMLVGVAYAAALFFLLLTTHPIGPPTSAASGTFLSAIKTWPVSQNFRNACSSHFPATPNEVGVLIRAEPKNLKCARPERPGLLYCAAGQVCV